MPILCAVSAPRHARRISTWLVRVAAIKLQFAQHVPPVLRITIRQLHVQFQVIVSVRHALSDVLPINTRHHLARLLQIVFVVPALLSVMSGRSLCRRATSRLTCRVKSVIPRVRAVLDLSRRTVSHVAQAFFSTAAVSRRALTEHILILRLARVGRVTQAVSHVMGPCLRTARRV